jgi:hypothetical protein
MPRRPRDPSFWISLAALVLSAIAAYCACPGDSAETARLRDENRKLRERLATLEVTGR